MSFKSFSGVVLACIVVIQVHCADIYIVPSVVSTGTITCSSMCPQAAPCGVPSLISLTESCDVYLGTGDWTRPLLVEASSNATDPRIFQWDSTGASDYIRNLKFTFVGDENVSLYSWKATGTTLNVTSFHFSICNSTFNMDDLEPFIFKSAQGFSKVFIQDSALSKSSGSSHAFSVGPPLSLSIDITRSNITMAALGIFSGSVENFDVNWSSLEANSLIGTVNGYAWFYHSHFRGFSGSLTIDPIWTVNSDSSNYTGLSRSEFFSWSKKSGAIGEFRVYNCVFTWVYLPNPPQDLMTVVALGSTFYDTRLLFDLIYSADFHTDASVGSITSNLFVRYNSSSPAFEIDRISNNNSISLNLNRFEDRYDEIEPSTCSVSLGALRVSKNTNLIVDRVCVSSTQWDGNLEASFIDVVPGGLGNLTATGNLSLSSFTSAVQISFVNNHLSYTITNASQGIDVIVDEMPRSLFLSWKDENQPLVVNDTWPVFTKVAPSAVSPTILQSDGTFTFNLSTECLDNGGRCMVNFTVLSVQCPCNRTNSLLCSDDIYGYPCSCIPPWSGPTCDIHPPPPISCPPSPPSPDFTCQNGTWVPGTSVSHEGSSNSHLVAILVPSIVGGLVLIGVIALIVYLKIRHDRHRKFAPSNVHDSL